jgi:hypothetical protein
MKRQSIAMLNIVALTSLMALLAISITASALTASAQVPGVTPQQGGTDEQSASQEQQTSSGGAQSNLPANLTVQRTVRSSVDPLPGHQGHQLALVLPPRNDGKVWEGTVTWTSSKPVELVVLQGYNSSVTADSVHGQPLTAPFGNGELAITLISPSTTGPIQSIPVASGSMNFVGNALAFHTLSGAKFTVTYSVDATAKKLTYPFGPCYSNCPPA